MTNTSGGLLEAEYSTPNVLRSGEITPLDAPVSVVTFVRGPPSTLIVYK